LSDLALLYTLNNQYDRVPFLYQEALNLELKRAGQTDSYASIPNNYAMYLDDMNKDQQAEEAYLKVLAIKDSLGIADEDKLNTWNNLAFLYANDGKGQAAENMFKKILRHYERQQDTQNSQYAFYLHNLAWLYFNRQQTLAAYQLFQQSLKIRRKHFEHQDPILLKSLCVLGHATLQLGKDQEAEQYFLEALQNNHKQEKAFNLQQLEQYQEQNFYNWEQALNALIGLQDCYWWRYNRDAQVQDLHRAYALSQLSMKIYNQVRNSFSDDEGKSRILSESNSVLGQALHQTQVLLQQDPNPKYIETVFRFAEQHKAVILADATRQQQATAFGGLPDSLIQREQELKTQLDALKIAQSQNKDPKINDQINALYRAIDQFKSHLEQNYPKYHRLKYTDITATIPDLQQNLQSHEALLEYVVLDTVVYLFVLRPQGSQFFHYPLPAGMLKQQIAVLRRSLTDYEWPSDQPQAAFEAYTASAYWFYQTLLAPALATLPPTVDHLIIIPDGELGHLPFEAFLKSPALPDPKRDYSRLDYLLRTYQISYNYSATLWKETKSLKPQTQNRFLGLAPIYPQQTLDSSQKIYLPPLPAAQNELEHLALRFEGDFHIGQAANEQFFKANAHQYGIIHLAMHGLLNQKKPNRSSLAFAPDASKEAEDQLLEAWEITHLNLNAQLVVLSACETGYGRFQKGEGVLSLAHSFLYAGSPSLVVSLWQVNDQITAVILPQFYEHLSKGDNKAQALRQAKLDYLREYPGLSSHPMYWAAFVQLGDSAPLSIPVKAKTRIWYGLWGLGALSLALALGYWFWRKRGQSPSKRA
jgi:CHAT domain-containing protein